MSKLRLLRTDSESRLFVADPWLTLRSEDYAGVRWPSCLLATDHEVDIAAILPALREILCAGATYFCFCGPNASAIHVATDGLDILLTSNRDIPVGRGGYAGTIGENDTSLEDSIFEFGTCAIHEDHTAFDRLVIPLGLQPFKDDLLRRLKNSSDFH
ncbi:MAG: hypothetical protein AAB074_00715 [Planctomycetota bacterium]